VSASTSETGFDSRRRLGNAAVPVPDKSESVLRGRRRPRSNLRSNACGLAANAADEHLRSAGQGAALPPDLPVLVAVRALGTGAATGTTTHTSSHDLANGALV